MRPLLPRSLLVSTRPPRVDSDGAAELRALGVDHPLVRVQRGTRLAAEQIRAVAIAQAVGVGALLQGTSWSLVILGSATFVQLVLGMRMLVLAESRHDVCRELIAGAGVLPDLPVVRREWRRLADPRRRARLAGSLEEVARAAVRPWAGTPGSARQLAEELARIRFLLVADEAMSGGG